MTGEHAGGRGSESELEPAGDLETAQLHPLASDGLEQRDQQWMRFRNVPAFREVQYFPNLGVSNNYISIVIPFLTFKIVFHYFRPALY